MFSCQSNNISFSVQKILPEDNFFHAFLPKWISATKSKNHSYKYLPVKCIEIKLFSLYYIFVCSDNNFLDTSKSYKPFISEPTEIYRFLEEHRKKYVSWMKKKWIFCLRNINHVTWILIEHFSIFFSKNSHRYFSIEIWPMSITKNAV